jgi:hypothetical protein
MTLSGIGRRGHPRWAASACVTTKTGVWNGASSGQPQAPTELRAALRAIDHHVEDYITRARLSKAA